MYVCVHMCVCMYIDRVKLYILHFVRLNFCTLSRVMRVILSSTGNSKNLGVSYVRINLYSESKFPNDISWFAITITQKKIIFVISSIRE